MSDGNNPRYPYDNRGRFIEPDSKRQIISPYDQDSRLFQDLAQRGIRPVKVVRIALAAAGQMSIPESGYHFVMYGDDGATPPAVNTTAIVYAQINTDRDQGDTPFPAKHARGFSGPFQGLFLTWPAQNGVYANVIIFKSAERPWIDGESAT